MVLLSPGSFNLYFLFGSLNLQLAMAFWYGISTYIKSLMEESRRIVSIVYISSLLLCLYIALFSGGYLLSIFGISL
jgi:small neutral amino acid transporter SnatA (MarC family)